MNDKNNYQVIEPDENKNIIEQFETKLEIDEKDKLLISLLSENPGISQSELAKATKLSQPAIGMRIVKLKKKGIISQITGINLRKVDLFLGKVDVSSKDPDSLIKEFEGCPYFLNALIMSGEFNVCFFFATPSLEVLEVIVNRHLRSNEKVSNVLLNIMITASRDFVMPVRLDPKNKCTEDCCNLPKKKIF